MSKDRNQQHLGVYTTQGFMSGMSADDAKKQKLTVMSAVAYRQHLRKMANIRKSIGLKG